MSGGVQCGRRDLNPGCQLGGLASCWRYGSETRLDDDRTTVEPDLLHLIVEPFTAPLHLIEKARDDHMSFKRVGVYPHQLVENGQRPS